MMKTKLFLLFLLFSGVQNSFAQNIRVNSYAGYVFNESFDLSDFSGYYSGTIKGGLQWGAGLEYMANKNFGIELSYLRQDTGNFT